MHTVVVFISLTLLLLGGGASMLGYGIKFEIEYKKGFQGKTTGTIVSITPRNGKCDISYTYLYDKYSGVSRRDCIFSVFDNVEIGYRKTKVQCSRMTSGLSNLSTSYSDLTACDGIKERIARQVLLSFGAIFIALYLICLVLIICKPKHNRPNNL